MFRSRIIPTALGAAAACWLTVAPALAQPAQQKTLMVEDVFKNVQVLKGIPVNQFMDTMGFFSAATGLNCTGCHVAESLQDLSKFAEDVPRKRMARQVRCADTPIGMVPTQVDYSDYREVAGVKMPYKIVISWTDGQSIIQLSQVQPNVAIDAAKFAQPAPAVVNPLGTAR